MPLKVAPYLFCYVLLLSSVMAQIRTWTTSLGRTFDAEFVQMEGERAIFKFENGRTFSTPLSEMSAADRATLQQARPALSFIQSPASSMNFGAPWPRGVRVDGEIVSKVISEDRQKGLYIYESPHYRFYSDARLTQDVLTNFAMMFEATYKYARTLPISLQPGTRHKGKLNILLFESMAGYIQGGGPAGSAGVFKADPGVVLVPMESLGLRRTGTGFSLDTTRHNAVLVHELSHQLTPLVYLMPPSRGWFSEGLAEYFGSTAYTWGYFQPDPYGNAALKYVTAYGSDGQFGRGLGNRISLPPLRNFFLMSYQEFSGQFANRNYGGGLLIVHYFFHMEGEGKATRITSYLRGLQQGATGESALAPLLGGGSYEKLEKEISDAWRRKGVEITFGG